VLEVCDGQWTYEQDTELAMLTEKILSAKNIMIIALLMTVIIMMMISD